MADSILVIGSGGREHTLAWKLYQSPAIKHIYVAPGNAGTETSGGKISNCSVDVKNHNEVSQFCRTNKINLVVVGPEDPLANGLADHLTSSGIKCFGPCQKGALIEASKEFAKQFMDLHNIPTARWKSFTDAESAKNHILGASYDALVIKASGLAAGKGVIVAGNKEEAVQAVDALKQDKGLSAASDVIVIEELLSGEEVSVLCFSDGTNISVMPPAQDHKRLLDDDKGPNTGGMGAYCRCPLVNENDIMYIKENILQKIVDGMKNQGTPYIGVLYAGLMLTKNGPKVLEFNCRFGDPETQVILPLLISDLYNIMLSCVQGTLNNTDVQWAKNKEAVGIVLVSGGYPGSYPKGKIITGLNSSEDDYIVFHAGTASKSGEVVTSGGRVLAVVALGTTLQEALAAAQKGCKRIDFEGKFYRSDIAKKAFKKNHSEGMTYKSSGVDIDSADDLVRKIKDLTKQTVRAEVCGGIGGFGGIFELRGYTDPYLVSKVSNIGEKLKVCQDYSRHEIAGYDLVATAVNEVICTGAEPLFFLDTYTCGKLDTEVAAQIITGIAKGCKESKCTLIGGETAEMPGMYADGIFDLTAFARGAVEKQNFLPRREDICEGDVVFALLSSNINCDGFSIVNNIMNRLELNYKSKTPFGNSTFEEILLTPNIIYTQILLPLFKKQSVKAAICFNKDSIEKGVEHSLPDKYSLALDFTSWNVPPIFDFIASNGNFSEKEMVENFNFGIDILLIVDKKASVEISKYLKPFGEKVATIGVVKNSLEGEKRINIINYNLKPKYKTQKRRVAVLASKKGVNLASLLQYSSNPTALSSFEIPLVVIKNDTEILPKVERFNTTTKVLKSGDFKSSSEMDSAISELLKNYGIEIVCLDGFEANFSKEFLDTWKGRVLNIHSSILPAFNSSDPCKEALSFGACISGCTVHLVEDSDLGGKILAQDAVTVDPWDTEETLNKKIQCLQQHIYINAIEAFIAKRTQSNSKVASYNSFENLDQDSFNHKVKQIMKSTSRTGFGEESFNGIFDLKASGYVSPYLVSGTDGVGTKLKIAQTCNKHNTIGIDLVAMCVNDILTHGAEPLIFLQSFDCGGLNPETALSVISGIAEGCKISNCALVGCEISELPSIYFNSSQCVQDLESYDVVGYAEGALEKENLLPRLNEIKENDIVIAIASSGVHSNGYSLVRKLVSVKNYRYQDPFPLDPSVTLGEVLLTPTKIYVRSLLPLMKKRLIKAAAHITGGGLTENIPRVLPSNFKVVLDASKWEMPLVLQWIAKEGQLSENEMLKTFNCGIGMALIVDKKYENEILTSLKNSGESAWTVGSVQHFDSGSKKVEIHNFKLVSSEGKPRKSKRRVGVLISGSGTNLQALIDYTQNPNNCSEAEIVLVVSNIPDVEGLKRAERAGIPTKVFSHKGMKREEFDMAVHALLQEAGVEIVCLAGFMRILSKKFVQLWQGKLLNVHPAILPSFKGVDAHRQALATGVKITGCTVHFVEPEVDAGAVIQQAAARVDENDNEKSLQEKVKVLEHSIFPVALELLATNKVARRADGTLQRNF